MAGYVSAKCQVPNHKVNRGNRKKGEEQEEDTRHATLQMPEATYAHTFTHTHTHTLIHKPIYPYMDIYIPQSYA